MVSHWKGDVRENWNLVCVRFRPKVVYGKKFILWIYIYIWIEGEISSWKGKTDKWDYALSSVDLFFNEYKYKNIWKQMCLRK